MHFILKKRSEERLACVASVKRGRERGNLGARELVGLLPRAWSRALIPFSFPLEGLPRRLRRDGLFSQANSLPARELSPRKLDWWQIKIRRILIPAGALVKNHAAYKKASSLVHMLYACFPKTRVLAVYMKACPNVKILYLNTQHNSHYVSTVAKRLRDFWLDAKP